MQNKLMNGSRWRIALAAPLAGMASLPACNKSQPPAPAPAAAPPAVSQEFKVAGFDPHGEPVVRLMQDGSLRIILEAMPPFFADDDTTEADFAEFGKVISKQIGLPVIRKDREVFVIRDALPGTAARLRDWLAACHGGRK